MYVTEGVKGIPFGSLLSGLGCSERHDGRVQLLQLLGLPDKGESLAALLAGRQVLPLCDKVLAILDPATNTCLPTLSIRVQDGLAAFKKALAMNSPPSGNQADIY